MNLGIGLSLTNFLRVPTVPLEDLDAAIVALFSSGEVGAWYDPSDSTTVFQDAAGTTPATVGDPVGLILDKSQGLVLGSELVTAAPNNGTTYSFDTFATDGVLITAASTSSSKLAGAYWDVGSLLPANTWVKVVITVSVAAGSLVPRIVFVGHTSGAGGFLSNFHTLTSGTHTVFLKTTGATRYLQIGTGNGLFDFSVSAISAKQLPGNHATQTTSAARPVLQQSGDLYYLDFDGVDDYMQTASVDFTSTDKMSVFAGINRKSSTLDMLVELSDNWNTNTGSFEVISGTDGSSGTGPGFHTASRGTAAVNAAQFSYTLGDFTPPVDAVLTATHDIAGDESLIRGNGTAYTPGTADKGAGNFGNHPLYICIRGSGLQYPGHYRIYGLIVRGAASNAGQISDAEAYLAAKSGVTLP